MADITYSMNLRVGKGFLDNSVSAGNITASMSLTGMRADTYTLSTSASSISTANLGSVGLGFMRNLSTATASTVQIGIEAGGSFVSFATLRAGEPAMFRLSSGTSYQARGSAGSRLRVDITEG
jgi:hypothetical protein